MNTKQITTIIITVLFIGIIWFYGPYIKIGELQPFISPIKRSLFSITLILTSVYIILNQHINIKSSGKNTGKYNKEVKKIMHLLKNKNYKTNILIKEKTATYHNINTTRPSLLTINIQDKFDFNLWVNHSTKLFTLLINCSTQTKQSIEDINDFIQSVIINISEESINSIALIYDINKLTSNKPPFDPLANTKHVLPKHISPHLIFSNIEKTKGFREFYKQLTPTQQASYLRNISIYKPLEDICIQQQIRSIISNSKRKITGILTNKEISTFTSTQLKSYISQLNKQHQKICEIIHAIELPIHAISFPTQNSNENIELAHTPSKTINTSLLNSIANKNKKYRKQLMLTSGGMLLIASCTTLIYLRLHPLQKNVRQNLSQSQLEINIESNSTAKQAETWSKINHKIHMLIKKHKEKPIVVYQLTLIHLMLSNTVSPEIKWVLNTLLKHETHNIHFSNKEIETITISIQHKIQNQPNKNIIQATQNILNNITSEERSQIIAQTENIADNSELSAQEMQNKLAAIHLQLIEICTQQNNINYIFNDESSKDSWENCQQNLSNYLINDYMSTALNKLDKSLSNEDLANIINSTQQLQELVHKYDIQEKHLQKLTEINNITTLYKNISTYIKNQVAENKSTLSTYTHLRLYFMISGYLTNDKTWLIEQLSNQYQTILTKASNKLEPATLTQLLNIKNRQLPLDKQILEMGQKILKSLPIQERISIIEQVSNTKTGDSTNTSFQSLEQQDVLNQINQQHVNACNEYLELNQLLTIENNFQADTCKKNMVENSMNTYLQQQISFIEGTMLPSQNLTNLTQAAKLLHYLDTHPDTFGQSAKDKLPGLIEFANTHAKQHTNKLLEIKEFVDNYDKSTLKSTIHKLSALLSSIIKNNSEDKASFDYMVTHINNGNKQDILHQISQQTNHQNTTNEQWLDNISQQIWKLISTQSKDYLEKNWAETYKFYKAQIVNRYPLQKQSNIDIDPKAFDEFFHPNGRLNQFIATFLQPLVQYQNNNWVWKRVDAHFIELKPEILTLIMHSSIIKEIFYHNNKPIELSLELDNLPEGISSININNGEEKINFNPQSIGPYQLHWQHQNNTAFIVSYNTPQQANIPVFQDSSAWGILKFLEQGQLHKDTNNPKRYIQQIMLDQKIVNINIMAFQPISILLTQLIHSFSCPESLFANKTTLTTNQQPLT